jgi:hypothetical protein
MNCSCNRSEFIKWAIYNQVVAYSFLYRTDIYGLKYCQPDNFIRKSKKGTKPKEVRFPKTLRALVVE